MMSSDAILARGLFSNQVSRFPSLSHQSDNEVTYDRLGDREGTRNANLGSPKRKTLKVLLQ